ncbi:MAG: peptidoglycan DD-metalloendopeptidase family protein, partial [Tuberibacillus sp.]
MSDKKTTPQEEQISKLRKLSRKRWFYPAVYLCAAAIVMIGSLWIQHSLSDNQNKDKGKVAMDKGNKEAIPVNSAKEVFQWPVTNKDAVKVAVPFYDVKADAAEQAAALVNYNNTYVPNKGLCIVAKDNKEFDVAAAMSGKVVKAKKDDLLGYVVEIEHKNGVKTVYQSLGSIAVEDGQAVSQGDVIGTSGTDKYMPDLGPHLHFELRKDGVAVDP